MAIRTLSLSSKCPKCGGFMSALKSIPAKDKCRRCGHTVVTENRHRVIFTGYMDLDEMPDDRGSIDNWLARFISDAVKKGNRSESGLDHLEILHIEWDLE